MTANPNIVMTESGQFYAKTAMPIAEPIEVWLSYNNPDNDEIQYVVLGSVHAETQTVIVSVTRPSGGSPHSTTNLQVKAPFPYPRKATQGWQDKLIQWLNHSTVFVIDEAR